MYGYNKNISNKDKFIQLNKFLKIKSNFDISKRNF